MTRLLNITEVQSWLATTKKLQLALEEKSRRPARSAYGIKWYRPTPGFESLSRHAVRVTITG